jgi:hypothetical protein
VKYLGIFFAIFILAGCESVPVQSSLPVENGVMARRFVALSQLRTGLSRAECATILGKEIVTGYELVDAAAKQYNPITISNPYRTEMISKNAKNYNVDYYLVGIKVADDKVSDDELVPLVFYNDHLIGSGWDFLNQRIRGN